jgi:hypothetical protein
MATHLRVFPDSCEPAFTAEPQQPTIRVSLADLLPILALARRHRYVWLKDFLDDEVTITPDLYDVICAFATHHRPSA